MARLTVTRAEVCKAETFGAVILLRSVEVDAAGPRDGAHEFVVHFNRKGVITCGLRVVPPTQFYQSAGDMPDEIVTAASRAYGDAWHS